MGHKNNNEMLITNNLYMSINLTPHCLRLAVKGKFKSAETAVFPFISKKMQWLQTPVVGLQGGIQQLLPPCMRDSLPCDSW